jgi:hypothetical protein
MFHQTDVHIFGVMSQVDLKGRFQMLRHKRLDEVIATDTYFANEKSIEGYHCARVFIGMTSNMQV